MNNKLAIFLVALCAILRSTDLFFRTDAIRSIFPIIVLAFWEHFVNLCVTFPILLKNKNYFNKINFKDLILFLLIGVGASALGLICFTSAFNYINPAVAVILQKLQPIIVIGLSIFFLKEKITRKFIIWSVIALVCGYKITFIASGLNPALSGKDAMTGGLLALLAAFFWGGGTVWGKLLMKNGYPSSFLTSMRFLLGTLFTCITGLVFYGSLYFNKVISSTNISLSIIYMALISGTLAVSFFYAGLKHVNASLVGILELCFPIFSIIISWLWLNKPLNELQIVYSVIMFYASYKVTGESEADN